MKRAGILAGLAALLLAFSCSSAPKSPDVFETRNSAASLQKVGDGFMERGDWAGAVSSYTKALQADSAIDYLEGVARCHASLGKAFLAAGEVDRAEAEFTDALEYGRLAASGPARSLAAAGLGEVAWARGDREGAAAHFAEAQTLAGKDEGALALALHDGATAKAGLGRAAEAKADLLKAAGINEKAGRLAQAASNRYLLASILVSEADLEGGFTQAGLALALDKRVENGAGIAQDLGALGAISLRRGRKAEAYDYWRRSFDSALSANLPRQVAKALAALKDLARDLGKDAEAGKYGALLARLEALEAAAAATGATGGTDGGLAPPAAAPGK